MEEPTATSVREIKSDAVDKSTVRGPSYLVAVFPLLLLASTAGAFPAIVDYIDLHDWKMAEGFVDSFIAPMIFALFFVFIQSTLSCRHWSFQSLVSSCLLMTTVVVLVLYGWILRYDRFDALLLAMSLLAVPLLGVVKIASNYFMRRWPRFSQRCEWYPLDSESGSYSSWGLIAISLAVVAWLATGIARVILSDSAAEFIGGPLNFSTNAVPSATGRYLLIGSLVFAYLIGVDHAVRSWLFP